MSMLLIWNFDVMSQVTTTIDPPQVSKKETFPRRSIIGGRSTFDTLQLQVISRDSWNTLQSSRRVE